MSETSRLSKQITELLESLEVIHARFALIGGLALAPHKVIRATQDIDLLADAQHADSIDNALGALGYRCVHRSGDAANYMRGDERVDLLYAHRPLALKLLGAAQRLTTALGTLPVISAEGLIGFKLQGFTNDPRRTQDLEDIRALLRANRARLDLKELREYFRLFDREALLQELLDDTA